MLGAVLRKRVRLSSLLVRHAFITSFLLCGKDVSYWCTRLILSYVCLLRTKVYNKAWDHLLVVIQTSLTLLIAEAALAGS